MSRTVFAWSSIARTSGCHDLRADPLRKPRRHRAHHAEPPRSAQQLHDANARRVARRAVAGRGERRCAGAAAHRRGPRLLRGAGSVGPRGRTGWRARGSGRIDRGKLPAAGARLAQPRVAGRVRGQRRRSRRRCEHRARLRYRDRLQIGKLHPGVLPDRPRSGFRRDVLPAAPRGRRARHGPRDAGRQAVRRAGRAVGADLEMRRRHRSRADRQCIARAIGAGAYRRLGGHQACAARVG